MQRDRALKKTEYRRYRFFRRYIPSEVELLAKTDELHGWLNGSATRKIITRYPEERCQKIRATPLMNSETGRMRGMSPHRFRSAFAVQLKPWNTLCLLPVITS